MERLFPTAVAPIGVAALAALLALSSAPPAHADPPLEDDLASLTERLRQRPSDVEALLARSEVLALAGRGDDSLADLRAAGTLAPADPRVALQRASVLHRLGRDEEALAELDALVARVRSVDSLGLRARVLLALDRVEDAVRAYDDALDLGPDVDLYLERGRLLEQLGRAEEAALGYHAGIAATGSGALRAASIELDLRIGRASRALATIDEVIATMPARARWLLLRARALDALGRAAEARTARTTALSEIDARLARRPSAALHVDRGEALLALGLAGEALEQARRARSLAPRYAPAIDLELRARRAAASSGPIGGAR